MELEQKEEILKSMKAVMDGDKDAAIKVHELKQKFIQLQPMHQAVLDWNFKWSVFSVEFRKAATECKGVTKKLNESNGGDYDQKIVTYFNTVFSKYRRGKIEVLYDPKQEGLTSHSGKEVLVAMKGISLRNSNYKRSDKVQYISDLQYMKSKVSFIDAKIRTLKNGAKMADALKDFFEMLPEPGSDLDEGKMSVSIKPIFGYVDNKAVLLDELEIRADMSGYREADTISLTLKGTTKGKERKAVMEKVHIRSEYVKEKVAEMKALMQMEGLESMPMADSMEVAVQYERPFMAERLVLENGVFSFVGKEADVHHSIEASDVLSLSSIVVNMQLESQLPALIAEVKRQKEEFKEKMVSVIPKFEQRFKSELLADAL